MHRSSMPRRVAGARVQNRTQVLRTTGLWALCTPGNLLRGSIYQVFSKDAAIKM